MRVQAIDVADGARTWTVLGDDHCCVEPIEEFLEYHRVLGSSPNTVRSYAKGLQLWWTFVAEDGVSWLVKLGQAVSGPFRSSYWPSSSAVCGSLHRRSSVGAPSVQWH
jgi:hypothetical protein